MSDLAEQLKALRIEVRALRDREAIREHLSLYGQQIDSRQYDEVVDSLFTEDAIFIRANLDETPDVVRGRDELREFLEQGMSNFVASHHMLGSVTVDVDGDFASSRTGLLGMYWQTPPTSRRPDHAETLTLVDSWIRFPAGWRIEERQVSASGFAQVDAFFEQGQRSTR